MVFYPTSVAKDRSVMQHKSNFYKNGGPKEDGVFGVWCEGLKLHKIWLLNL